MADQTQQSERPYVPLTDEEYLQTMGAPALTDEDIRALNAL